MKIRIVNFLFIVFTFFPSLVFSQDFYFKCYYKKNIQFPVLYNVPQNNVFNQFDNITLIKDSNNSCHVTLKPSRIVFFKIGLDAVLVSPGDHLEGNFDGIYFQPTNTNSNNYKLARISRGITSVINNYPKGGDFATFKRIAGLLIHYIDSTNEVLNKNIQPWRDQSITIALREYMSARLAHFLVLPILLQENYEKKELAEMIRKNVQMKYPEYWVQMESARIFLETYYRKLDLPGAGYNLQKSFEDKFFTSSLIKKFVSYYYFLECMEKGTVKSKDQLLHDWQQVTSKLIFTKEEQETMKGVRKDMQQIGENVTDDFITLPLVNNEGIALSISEKKALIAGPNVIFDFWASWCVPCKERMTKLNSDRVTINHKQFRIIYISIDDDQGMWKGAHFSFLNKMNSFRNTSQYNDFVKNFDIGRIPRYILINKSTLVSSHFTFE